MVSHCKQNIVIVVHYTEAAEKSPLCSGDNCILGFPFWPPPTYINQPREFVASICCHHQHSCEKNGQTGG
jgi:hypothetical protein